MKNICLQIHSRRRKTVFCLMPPCKTSDLFTNENSHKNVHLSALGLCTDDCSYCIVVCTTWSQFPNVHVSFVNLTFDGLCAPCCDMTMRNHPTMDRHNSALLCAVNPFSQFYCQTARKDTRKHPKCTHTPSKGSFLISILL